MQRYITKSTKKYTLPCNPRHQWAVAISAFSD